MVGKGSDATESPRSRVARSRPNWWVILAVTLGLMALLVATAGGSPHPGPRRALGRTAAGDGDGTARGHQGPGAPVSSTTTTSTVASAPVTAPEVGQGIPSGGSDGSLASTSRSPRTSEGTDTTGTAPPAPTTPITSPPVTTTTAAGVAQPADRTQTEGYLDPPAQASRNFDFPGAGAMNVTVVWSGDTYLTMSVSCPGGGQNVGGTSAMEASIPDASGECQATVSEPASESTALTFTISMGPANG